MKPKELIKWKTREILGKRCDKPEGQGHYRGWSQCDLVAWGEWTERGLKVVQRECRNG